MLMGEPTYLEHAILHTVKYFNVLGMPLTATQLWRFLLVPDPGATPRWEGHAAPSLVAVAQTLRDSPWLTQAVEHQWGYYFLKGRHQIVPAWLHRHAIAQQKWKIIHRFAAAFSWVPFVDMLAVSGSMALYNTKPSSDFDILIVARSKRIWTVRLLLLLMAHLVGRRRKHWDQDAPNKFCFNHYVTTASLTLPPAIRNEYTAALYAHLVPIWGQEIFGQFMAANAPWLKRFGMYRDPVNAQTLHSRATGKASAIVKRQLEALLLEPLGDGLESLAERMQRRIIARHTTTAHGGRIVVSNEELAFHPHSRVPGILSQFAQDAGQRQLL